jgi:hypothetical protein
MTPLQHVGIIEELANNRAEPCEFKAHIIAVREALLACEQLQTDHTSLKNEKKKRDAELVKLDKKNKHLEGQLLAYHTGRVYRM